MEVEFLKDSSDRNAAVNINNLTRDIVRLRQAKQQHAARGFFGAAASPQRDPISQIVKRRPCHSDAMFSTGDIDGGLATYFLRQPRFDPAECNRVDVDSQRSEFSGETLGQSDQSGFCGGIADLAG